MGNKITEIFDTLLTSGKKVRIKLLGDSITHGVGGKGFEQSGEHIVAEFSRNPNGHCWANLFRSYMEEHYNCEVVNNACTGTKIEFVIENFDKLVDESDDIVICTIGTNNRHQYFRTGEKREKSEYMAEFYSNIIRLNDMFTAAGRSVVFMANIPASESNERDGEDYWRIFHMDDVNILYRKAADERGFPFISMFDAFNNYCKDECISVDSLLADGLHPNDRGHEVIFELLLSEIGVSI